MAPLILAIFVLLALATGAAFVWGAPILGVPLLIVALGVVAFGAFAAHARRVGDIQQEREDARSPKTDFTERDRQTLA